jgi:trehalose synthase
MRRSLEDYRGIVGDEVIGSIYHKARRLYGRHILHINSTYQGGGVAEILNGLVILMNDVGIKTGWRILHGTPDFFTITKKFHNALQGEPIHLTQMKKQLYLEHNENFSRFTHIDHDCVIVHDQQPLPLIKFYPKRQPWMWRCHIDLSKPTGELLDYLKTFVLRYDVVILSNANYHKEDLPVEQRIIYPSIDPLSPKNKDISASLISAHLKKFGVNRDKPLITQVSRFDKWKNPEGVIKVFEKVREKVDCRLVLCGSMATDDPESLKIYTRLYRHAKRLLEKGDVVFITSENQILVNALQRVSSVIVQKSLKEGFGLTVTEALWKGAPVVASNVGGIPLQIVDGENGFLLDPQDFDGFADRIVAILQDTNLARELGQRGKESVRKNFLITRHLMDFLDLLNDILWRRGQY